MLNDPVHPSNLTDAIELLKRERDEQIARLTQERDEARADLAAETATRAALRLMLRETAQTNATGIDYALRCQRERDEARAERDRALAEVERLRHSLTRAWSVARSLAEERRQTDE